MRPKHLSIVMLGMFALLSCENNPVTTGDPLITKSVFSGYVQKGPFINGSSLTISELDLNLNQTGRMYSTRIIDNTGAFEQKNIELVSPYVELKADGYYFNEVTGKSSAGQITLNALADISGADAANVNVLTHLERARVEYLITEGGKSFADAKTQAQGEILDIFSLQMPEAVTSESLNLTGDGILLAVSAILQGALSTADMMELMANISADIRADGKLDNTALGSRLVNNANMLASANVRKNLEDKYAETGSAALIPDFEQYIALFLENTSYEQTAFIIYPPTGAHGDNILSSEVTAVKHSEMYSFAADVPAGADLKVILKGGLWYYVFSPTPPINWTVGEYDSNNLTQEFKLTEGGKPCDLSFIPYNGTLDATDNKYYITVEIYENDAIEPRIKRLEILNNSDTNIPDSTQLFMNNAILN